MANLLDIRRRIRSVKSTQQITKAMKMVAAARLRRSQDRILATRPYAEELRKVIGSLAARLAAAAGAGSSGKRRHPLLESRPVERTLVVVVTGDKGLAGSFNATVLRRANELLPALPAPELLLLGKKGGDFYRRRRWKIRDAHGSLFTNVTYQQADAIAREITRGFVAGEYDRVVMVYNAFKSIMTQVLTEETLLPLAAAEAGAGGTGTGTDYLFEPSADEIFAELLPRYVSLQVYRVLLESQAAEHAARMTAMDSATKNAGDMIDRLTLNYNRARQAAITKELIEVVSGASALAG
jgi:F-type H+-transporting ATPase subunit gamma